MPQIRPQEVLMARLSFTEHPGKVGETYFQHMGASASFGWRMLAATGAAFVHAVFPFLFVRTGSTIVTELHDRMVRNRVRHATLATGPEQPAIR
jgi:hypothetical protein